MQEYLAYCNYNLHCDFLQGILQNFSRKSYERKNTMKEKNYKTGSYANKKVRPKRTGTICPVCSRCSDRSFCKHRKNIKLMRKCPNCKACQDKDNCDVFYISFQNKIRIPVGVDDDTGETIMKSFSGKTGNEAIYNSEQYKRDVESGRIKPELKKKVHSIVSIIEEFEKEKNNAGTTNDNSYLRNKQTLNRIKKYEWATFPIKSVKKQQLIDFLNDERNAMKSNSVLKKDKRMLQKAYEIAKYYHYITENYFEGPFAIKTPKSLKPDRKTQAFTQSENMTLLKYLYTNDVSHKNEYLLCFHSGLRIGEVLSLKVQDIDFENNCIHISRTTTNNKSGHVILGQYTKTSNGIRDIVITELTEPILRDAIAKRNPSEENLLFCKPDGSLYTDSALNSCLKRICEKAGIKSRAHNHKLRKNFNTRSIEAGVDYKVLEENAGHSDITITLDTYTEAQQDFQEKELQKYVESVKMMLGDLVNQTN